MAASTNTNPEHIDADLSHLYPAFATIVKAILVQVNHETSGKYHGLKEVRVFEGYRSTARQLWLYAQGRTRSGSIVTQDKIPRKHGYGLAVDIVGYDVNGEPSWDWPDAFWQQLGHAARTQGCEYGGDWVSFPDTAHVQMPDSYKEAHITAVTHYLHGLGLTTP